MTEQPKDGGPAFPVTDGHAVYAPGMSLRDWFAGQALAAITMRHGTGDIDWQSLLAYEMADAMLSAREVPHD
jgi:uncharacterized protein YodC (DUF2158 family)